MNFIQVFRQETSVVLRMAKTRLKLNKKLPVSLYELKNNPCSDSTHQLPARSLRPDFYKILKQTT
jgi:hypothetical protein